MRKYYFFIFSLVTLLFSYQNCDSFKVSQDYDLVIQNSSLISEIRERAIGNQRSEKNIDDRPRVGIFFLLWHCAANNSHYNKVIEQAKVDGDWGPIPGFHWRNVPKVTGNITEYCLKDIALVRKQFDLLERAQIDYLVVDFTNQYSIPGSGDGSVSLDMMDGFDNLIQVSSERGSKMKIVPWVSFQGNLHTHLIEKLNRSPDVRFIYEQQPLIIASWDKARSQHLVASKIIEVENQGWKVRKMWGLTQGLGESDVWSYMEKCQSGFLSSQGNGSCNHFKHRELASVSAAYQETHMTNFDTAVPKFGGRTFLRQLSEAQASGAKLILINAWNEWIAQRFCLGSDGRETHLCENSQAQHFPYGGRPVFVDLWDREYSRDFEPDTNNSTYYNLLVESVAAFKNTSVPSAISAPTPAPTSNPVPISTPASNPTSPPIFTATPVLNHIVGNIDVINKTSENEIYIQGWACKKSYNQSIKIEIYINGPKEKGTLLTSSTANKNRENAVQAECQSSSNHHGFSLTISGGQKNLIYGKKVYIYGIDPTNSNSKIILARSGLVAPAAPVVETPVCTNGATNAPSCTLCPSGQVLSNSVCAARKFNLSGNFGTNASGAQILACGLSAVANSAGGFTLTQLNAGLVCNNITIVKAGYNCTVSNQGPVSLVSNFNSVRGSCTLIPQAIVGVLDEVKKESFGISVRGWTCQKKNIKNLNVQLYVNGPIGVGNLLTSGRADISREDAVQMECESNQSNFGYDFKIQGGLLSRIYGKSVYAYAVDPMNSSRKILLANGGVVAPIAPSAVQENVHNNGPQEPTCANLAISGVCLDVKKVRASVGGVRGQTGQWWCENHFGKNLGGYWQCHGSSCQVAANLNNEYTCIKRNNYYHLVNASVGGVRGQTGQWWCDNHFGKNLGGTWTCIGVNCQRTINLNEEVKCIK